MSSLPMDLLGLPDRERLALADSLESVARLIRGDLSGAVIRPAEDLLAQRLLNAWWLELGSEAVGVAALFEVHPDTKLGEIVAELVNDADGCEIRARAKLGKLLSRLEKSGRDFAGYRVGKLGEYCGSQTWACQPIEPPDPPTAAGLR
jgi:hypothetical protein